MKITDLDEKTVFLVLFLVMAVASSLTFLSLDEVKDNSSRADKPNIIMIDIDRLNSDRMPCYGYHRNTTPNMCRFGKQNIMFEQAISQSGWTAGSLSSIFTSQYTEVHGIENHGDSLGEEHTTMAEILRSEGYETAAFPALPENSSSFVHLGYNLDQGFDKYASGGYSLERNGEKFGDWEKKTEEPFFAFIQGFDPHRYVNLNPPVEKYYRAEETPEEFIEARRSDYGVGITDIVKRSGTYYLRRQNGELIQIEKEEVAYANDQYDDSIKAADQSFGELIELLKDRGIYSDSIIIVTANHGEMLDSRTFAGIDRRFGHGQVWDDDIKVPLMIHLPEEENERITRQVQLIDILPTVIEEAEIDIENSLEREIQGESLVPLYEDGFFRLDSYSSEYAFSTDHSGGRTAIRNSSWKLIENSDQNLLHDLENNPNETINAISENPDIAKALEERLQEHHIRNQRLRAKIG